LRKRNREKRREREEKRERERERREEEKRERKKERETKTKKRQKKTGCSNQLFSSAAVFWGCGVLGLRVSRGFWIFLQKKQSLQK